MKLTSILTAASLVASPALCAPLQERDSYPGTIFLDDADISNVYSGTWSHIKQDGLNLYQGTESYTSEANAEVTITYGLPTVGYLTHITINSTTKGDRGPFSVYCGTSLVGTGNELGGDAESLSGVVFDADVGECVGDFKVVLKNDKGATFFAWDSITIDYMAEAGTS